VEIKNKFVALQNSDECLDINSAWESNTEDNKTSAKDNLGYHRLKHNKPWFDECSKLIEQKQTKLQQLQNPSQINGDNLQNLRHETSSTLRNKRKEYLKDKMNELETNNKKQKYQSFVQGHKRVPNYN
jgi:hypothetical protein